MQDILELRAAITGARRAFAEAGRAVPIQAQVALDVTGRMLLGTDIAAVATILRGMQADVIGPTAPSGPSTCASRCGTCARSATCRSGDPERRHPAERRRRAVYPLGPSELAEQLAAFVASTAPNVVGGCCGTTPEHIRLLREAVATAGKQRRPVFRPAIASAMRPWS